jgi:hypothetical protein
MYCQGSLIFACRDPLNAHGKQQEMTDLGQENLEILLGYD